MNLSEQELAFIIQGQKNQIAIQAKQLEQLIYERHYCEQNEDMQIMSIRRSLDDLIL